MAWAREAWVEVANRTLTLDSWAEWLAAGSRIPTWDSAAVWAALDNGTHMPGCLAAWAVVKEVEVVRVEDSKAAVSRMRTTTTSIRAVVVRPSFGHDTLDCMIQSLT